MLGLAVFIVLLIISSLAVRATASAFGRRANITPAEQIRTGLFDADQHLSSEFQRAREAMNDASGQTWRNLAG